MLTYFGEFSGKACFMVEPFTALDGVERTEAEALLRERIALHTVCLRSKAVHWGAIRLVFVDKLPKEDVELILNITTEIIAMDGIIVTAVM